MFKIVRCNEYTNKLMIKNANEEQPKIAFKKYCGLVKEAYKDGSIETSYEVFMEAKAKVLVECYEDR